MGIRSQQGNLKAFTLQLLQTVQNSLVFDAGTDDVAAAIVVEMRDTLQCQVVGFCGARCPDDLTGITAHQIGDIATGFFDGFLGATDILVNLLPLTPETEGILNGRTFAELRRGPLEGGPVVVNAGRGRHQREADLVAALTDGTLGAASLDVFEVEPLPTDSPLWALDNCYITPHLAGVSNEGTGVAYFSKIIRAHEAGEPLINVVDRARGY